MNENKTLKFKYFKISKIERRFHIIKFMVKFYTKNHEIWYIILEKSQKNEFYKNQTSSGDTIRCTELGRA